MATQPNWSLESELNRLAGTVLLSDALQALGVIPEDNQAFEIRPSTEGWFRSGGETYLCRFSVHCSGIVSKLVLKACVPFSPARSVDATLQAWIDRRQLLASRGINTPRLYGWGYGVVLYEDISYPLKQVVQERAQ